MQNTARLIDVEIPERPAGVVLVLHGGAGRKGRMMVSPTQLSVLRLIPIAHRIARRGAGRLAVVRLLNSTRGWDSKHTPVSDAQWAMQEMANRLGPVPVCLVGHSLGGRAAILAASGSLVRSTVALAPWLDNADGRTALDGRQLLIIHGSKDRIASPAKALLVTQSLSRTADAGYIRIDGGKHAMLKHHQKFGGYAADFVVATLLGEEVDGPVGRVLTGEKFVSA